MARHDERTEIPAGGKGRMVETSSLESGEHLVHEAVERGCITGSVHSIEQLEFEIDYVEKNKKYTTREVAKKAFDKAEKRAAEVNSPSELLGRDSLLFITITLNCPNSSLLKISISIPLNFSFYLFSNL